MQIKEDRRQSEHREHEDRDRDAEPRRALQQLAHELRERRAGERVQRHERKLPVPRRVQPRQKQRRDHDQRRIEHGDQMVGIGQQPPLAPPAWLFPVAWTILYILMGVASYLIWHAGRQGNKMDKQISKTALWVYGIQLVLNFAWTLLFFNLGWHWFAFAVLMVMWCLEIVLLCLAKKVSMGAFWCLLPYLLWTTFAAYLNIMIAILN